MSNILKIEVDPRVFTEIFWKVKKSITRFVISFGGAGSSKSYSQSQIELAESLERKHKILVVRKVAATLRQSVFALLKKQIIEWNMSHIWKINKSDMSFVNLINRSEIILMGLDDVDKLKSIDGVTRIWIEEADQIDENDLSQLNLRLRGVKLVKPQITLTFNPINEKHWIKKQYIDTKRDDVTIIHSTFKNNRNHEGTSFLDDEYIRQLEALKKTNPTFYKVYALGEWGVFEVDSPYMISFDEININKEAIQKEGQRIIFSFDFNVDNCACIATHVGEDFIYIFNELLADNLPKLLDKVEKKYKNNLATCLITGDRSGKNRNHLQRDDTNSYRMIKNRLKLKDGQFKIVINPQHADNRFTCNTILAFHPNVYFHPDNCPETIFDMKYVECDQNEKLIKKDRNIANQKADLLDCVRYLFNTFKAPFVKNYKFK